MSSYPPPEPDDGQVLSLTWKGVTSQLGEGSVPGRMGINAHCVTEPGVYTADFTWDGQSPVLTIPTPTKQSREDAAAKPPDPMIRTLVIQGWGEAPLTEPLDWDGAKCGTVTITFTPNPAQQSGPVGGGSGP